VTVLLWLTAFLCFELGLAVAVGKLLAGASRAAAVDGLFWATWGGPPNG
jgi:hypothetical protein